MTKPVSVKGGTERLFWYFDRVPVPKPGESVTLPDGRKGTVDTAHGRKLTVIVRA